ncbi:hepatitis A virus cellular receptor 2-like [Rhinoderma darwinii]|uniref:hepatitis A virus cellular receptor 2-like n=1 Tax=Rhinoderma darwinii TaxID=43563 RepID=UPI003F6735E8
MCWGRGGCSASGCYNTIIQTDGRRVTWRESDRYQLLGDIIQGNVSLTITGVTREDEGTYCCRVEISGLFNDVIKVVKVQVKQEENRAENPVENSEENQAENPHFTTMRPSMNDINHEFDHSVTSKTESISSTLQENIPSETSRFIYVIGGVVGALFLVVLVGVILYICKSRSRMKTKTESRMSAINMETLVETGNETMENIYT